MTTTAARLLIATGATGGHFFPAVTFARTYRKEHPDTEIHLLMNRVPDFAREEAAKAGMSVHLIPFRPPGRVFSLQALGSLIEYLNAIVKTLRLIGELRPSLVVGFGSYGTFFAVMGAAMRGIPVLLHEQNAVAGRANQVLSLWAARIGTSFPETVGRWPDRKVFWSGYPLRSSFIPGRAGSGSGEEKMFTVLVFGGSQGAERLNRACCDMACRLLGPEEKAQFAVIHIVGNHDLESIRCAYRDAGVHAEVIAFSDRMAECLTRADLVISRSGAGTLFELAAVGRAAILVPYPYARGHQKANAEYAARRGWAQMILDEEASSERLYAEVNRLRGNPDLRFQMAAGIQKLLKPDADRILAEAAWKLQHGRT